MAALTCPHCGAYANFSCKSGWSDPSNGQALGAWACANCSWPVSGAGTSNEQTVNKPVDWYPRAVGGKEFPDVPTSIARDADEAHRCESIGASRAAVVMARRVVQALAIDNGAKANARLVDQIDELADKSTITDSMRQVAHAVRLSGNDGAHPHDDPNLDDLDEEDVRDVLLFMDSLLDHVYQTPAKVARINAKRTGGS